MTTKIKEMTEGSPLKLILKFTLPILLGNILQQTYSFIDAVIVGQYLGVNDLAAIGTSGSVIFLILGFCIGCGCGFGIPVAQSFGAKDYITMRRYVAVSIKLSWVMSIVIAIIASILCTDILRGISTPDKILDEAYDYLLVIFIGIPCTFFYNLLSSILRALGDSKTPFWFLLFSTILNVILDLIFIIVFKWGVTGAGVATILSQGISAALCYLYMIKNFKILNGDAIDRKFRWNIAKRLLYIGVPMGLQFSITAIGSIMLQSANNALGTAYVAAYTAAMRIKMLFICAFDSLGIAMATYTGQNYGAGKPERILKGVKASAKMFMIYAIFTYAILMLFSDKISLLFVDSSELDIIKNTSLFLHINCHFFPLLGLLCTLRYTIQGAGFTNLAMLSGVFEMVARGLVGIFAVPSFGFIGVCFGDPAAWVAANILLIPAFIYVYKKIKLIKYNN